MPQNGEANDKFGVYVSACCGAEIVITAGALFPHCPNHPMLATMWNPIDAQGMPARSDSSSDMACMTAPHVENRRLFHFARGKLTLEASEERHFHECESCNAVVRVFARSIPTLKKNPESSSAA